MFRYFPGITAIEIDRMTIEEYLARKKAALLSQIDQRRNLSEAVWNIRNVQAYDKDFQYIFKKYDDLFRFDAMEKAILTGIEEAEERASELEERLNRANQARAYAQQVLEERRKLSESK